MKEIYLFFVAIIFIACEKKELPAPAYDRGDVNTVQVEMTSNYKNQVWVSLNENKVVSTNYKTDWDLAFESMSNGEHIILNSSKAMKVYKTNFTSLSQVTDTTGLGINARADVPSGNLDSTAIGDWKTNNTVYIVNRGYSETGQHLGYCKLKLLLLVSGKFVFEYGDVYGSQIYQGSVIKDADYNFVYFSFNTNQQVVIEPNKLSYDLCFSQYTHIFSNPVQYYQVTGVLNNTFKTRIAKITDKAFADVSINDTLGRMFYSTKNVIGYNWKAFDLNTNLYTVDPSQVFIVNDSKGFYYKLHFIDFYNKQGIKGYPSFEFKKL